MWKLLNVALAEEAEAADAAAESSWLTQAFEEFGETTAWGWVLLGALLIGGAAVFALLRKKQGNRRSFWTAKTMAVGAMCMALASVLSMIKLWHMPMGGSITLASALPLLLFAYCYGVGPGLTLGVLYGVMQFILGGQSAVAYGIVPLLLDYPLAFGALGLAGLARGWKEEKTGIVLGCVVGCFGRFVMSFLSGWIFYGAYCGDYGFTSPVLYSICYNGAYLLPDCLICVLLSLLVGKRLVREMRN